jgi:hypothetical protein
VPTYTYTPIATSISQVKVTSPTQTPAVSLPSGICTEPAINSYLDLKEFNFQIEILDPGNVSVKSAATSPFWLASDASFSTNGVWVAFVATLRANNTTQIRIAKFEDLGTSWNVYYAKEGEIVSSPAVNNQGDIVFQTQRGDERPQLWLAKFGTAMPEPVAVGTEPFWFNNNTFGYVNPISGILYSSNGVVSTTIFSSPWDFGNNHNATVGGQYGSILAFEAENDGLEYVVAYHVGTEKPLWVSPMGATQPVLSKDGTFIVFVLYGQIYAHAFADSDMSLTQLTDITGGVSNPVLHCNTQVYFTWKDNTIVSVVYAHRMKSVKESGLTIHKKPANANQAYYGTQTLTRPELNIGDAGFVNATNSRHLQSESDTTISQWHAQQQSIK